jgi:hypothetical protein
MFNRVLGKDHIAVVVLLEDLVSGTRIIVSNTHLHWDAAYSDVKLVQTALLLEEIEKVAHGFAKYPPRPPDTPAADDEDSVGARPPPPTYADGTKIPLLACGDYNSMPSSGVYDFLSTGSLSPTHPDFLSHTYGNYTSEGLRHKLGLKSAYTTVGAGGVPEEILSMTNVTPGFRGVLDYVWYSPGNLILNSVVGEIEKMYLEKTVGFPNPHFPSEYVLYTPQRDRYQTDPFSFQPHPAHRHLHHQAPARNQHPPPAASFLIRAGVVVYTPVCILPILPAHTSPHPTPSIHPTYQALLLFPAIIGFHPTRHTLVWFTTCYIFFLAFPSTSTFSRFFYLFFSLQFNFSFSLIIIQVLSF